MTDDRREKLKALSVVIITIVSTPALIIADQLPPTAIENVGHPIGIVGSAVDHMVHSPMGAETGWMNQDSRQKVIETQASPGNPQSVAIFRNQAGRGRKRGRGFNRRGRQGNVMDSVGQGQQILPRNIQAGKGKRLKNNRKNKGKARNRKRNNKKNNPKIRQPSSFEAVDLSSFGNTVEVAKEENPLNPIVLPGQPMLPSDFVNAGIEEILAAEPSSSVSSSFHPSFDSLNKEPLTVVITPNIGEQGNKGDNHISGMDHMGGAKMRKAQKVVIHTPGIFHSDTTATNQEPQTVFDLPVKAIGNRRNGRKQIRRKGRKLQRKNKKQNKGKKRKDPKVRQPKELIPVELSSTDHTNNRANVPSVPEPTPVAEPQNIETIPGFGMIDWGAPQGIDFSTI